MGTVAILALASANVTASAQQQQPGEASSYSIAPQDLGSALTSFAENAGLRLLFPSILVAGKTSPGLNGSFSAEAALSQLLAGSGLTYRFTSSNTVTITDPAAVVEGTDGSIVLGEVNVTAWATNSGIGWDGSPESVYLTPGSVSAISAETLQNFAGTTPSDILKSAPGVLSGESRNSGGLDVNIRGMQGMSRVPVSIDGAQNSTAVYRGYQGIANRSFIDPDFISGISIEKGPSSAPGAAGAIGGSVNMRTVTADDIVPAGESFGIRLKVEGSSNTSPVAANGTMNLLEPFDGLGMSRGQVENPGPFAMTGGSSSVLFGSKTEVFDFVAGFSRRRLGNYHAGTNGPYAPQPSAPHSLCALYAGYCDGMTFYEPGLTAYLPGEEVLNTSQDTTSGLLKTTFRFNDEHVLELGFSRYESRYGETYPMGFITNLSSRQQGQPSHTAVDSVTARYGYNPDNDLIDFQWNTWGTSLVESSALSDGSTNFAEKWAKSYGTDVSNTSRFSVFGGDLALQYGGSYRSEDTAPSKDAPASAIQPRNGSREESSVFINAKLNPTDWLELTAGTRYHSYEAQNNTAANTTPIQSANAVDFNAGLAVTPIEGVQLFGTYSNAARLPSLFESVGGFATLIAPGLTPETANNFEAGVNLQRDDLLFSGDTAGLKFAYFNNTTDDYISRAWEQRLAPHPIYGGTPYLQNFMVIDNIDQARFSGFEMSASYDNGGFSADLNGTYYNNVEFCRTAATCMNSSLAADYATNQIPPEYTASLTLSQKFLEDRLTLGGRLTHIGPRAAGAQPTQSGASPFIAAIPWEPYTVLDVFGRYELTDYATLTFGIENVTDLYYVDPLNLALLPSPGRTIKLGVVGEFSPSSGGGEAWADALAPITATATNDVDWTGFYAGIHGAQLNGNAEALDFKRYVGATMVEDRNFYLGDIDGVGIGLQGGANYQLSSNFVLGVEGEVSWGGTEFSAMTSRDTYFDGSIDWLASLSARAGFSADRFLVYGKGGVTVAGTSMGRVIADNRMISQDSASGWTLGAGVEYAVSDNLSIKGEYSFTTLSGGSYGGTMPGQTTTTGGLFKTDQVKIGMNYRF
ncbi:MAG: TonB-dependent receptor [Candidatus Devosia phytovorans]|uniref:TonB-dependent receptor n=1 Tax=Candidatus Devosia phytovorans TaxID=3121372 RepID=A0AAJ5VXJ7_9HYPH|nr:TonB-dependent receptor [Devosia sp.]WEK06025.1 MAG: TonB-dependent receptor [Devosia sp.]